MLERSTIIDKRKGGAWNMIATVPFLHLLHVNEMTNWISVSPYAISFTGAR